MAQLDFLRRNGQLQEAINVRQAARLLGVATPEPEEMGDLAGRDVVHQYGIQGSALLVGLIVLVLLLFAIAGLWWYASTHATTGTVPIATNPVVNPTNPVVVPIVPGRDRLDIEVINPGGKL